MKSVKSGYTTKVVRKRRPSKRTWLSTIGTSVLFAVTLGWTVQSPALRVVIIGDSTVQTYAASDPKRGWGQELGYFFKNGAVTIINKAIGGRSSRSFIEDGHWSSTLAILQKGDFLFIQFGHNDRDTKVERYTDTAGYRKYLTQYVTESRAKGAIPILVSPMNMNTWNGSTLREVFNEGANDYHTAMLRVVNERNVPFIDLEKKTAKIFQSLGQAYLSAFIFNPGEGTHFQEMGALLNARCVAEGIKELADHPDVRVLAAELGPQYRLTVTPNKTDAGMITASGTYPPGAPLTIKVVPNAGQTFERWQDAVGKTITTATQFFDTMKAMDASYTAMYRGGTPVITPLTGPFGGALPPDVSIVEKPNGSVTIRSAKPIQYVRATSLAGRTVFRMQPGVCHIDFDERAITGAQTVTVTTSSGSRTIFVLPLR